LLQYKIESFYLLPRVEEERLLLLLLLFDVADPREEELLRCTLDLFEELLRERFTCAGELLRWLA